MTIEQALGQALHHHQSERLAEAEQLYRQILAHQPDHADALHLLGAIAHQVGRHDVAVDLIGKALSIRPDWPEALTNQGEALRALGRFDEASAACRQAIAFKPDYADAFNNLGTALADSGQLEAAIVALGQAIALKPGFAEAHFNLGNVLRDQGRTHDAIAAYRIAIVLKPNFADALSNLGLVLIDCGRVDEAIDACRQAITLTPNLAVAHCNLGAALNARGQFDEAIAACRQAIALRPDYAKAYSSLAVALESSGQFSAGLAFCRKAVALKPDEAEPHYNFGLMLLTQGEFAQGWPEYEWRWRMKRFSSPRWSYSKPQWDGSNLKRRTILLHAEQGFGDTLQFIRYVPLLANSGATVVVTGPPQLERLLKAMPGISQWLPAGEPPPAFDVHCPLLSLPLAFGTTLQTIPKSVPYLHADADLVDHWRKRIGRSTASFAGAQNAFNVGLAWAGTPQHKNDRNRSLTLARLAPLAEVPDLRFYSLQKGEPARQAKDPPVGMTLVDLTEDLHDFADSAALIANLDLVISVDTAVAHLAGALGKPVWTLLPFVPDWRWLLRRTDSLWYPTMHLFRQPTIGDWDSVIREVAARLRRENEAGK